MTKEGTNANACPKPKKEKPAADEKPVTKEGTNANACPKPKKEKPAADEKPMPKTKSKEMKELRETFPQFWDIFPKYYIFDDITTKEMINAFKVYLDVFTDSRLEDLTCKIQENLTNFANTKMYRKPCQYFYIFIDKDSRVQESMEAHENMLRSPGVQESMEAHENMLRSPGTIEPSNHRTKKGKACGR